MKKVLFTVIRALVSSVLIIILLYIMRDKYGDILHALKGTRPSVFMLAFLVFTCALTISSTRLKLLVSIQRISITFPQALSLTFVGYFFNNFLPTAIGGDVVKAYYLSQKSDTKTPAFTAIFVDRAIGLITMVFMAFVALFFAKDAIIDIMVRNSIYLITIIALAVVVFVTNKRIAKNIFRVFFFLKPVEEQLKRAYESIYQYKHHNVLILQSIMISFISQLFFFFGLGILAISIGSRIPVGDILLKMPIVSALSLLPSINGLGLREGSTVMLFGPLIGREQAFALSVLWLAVLIITSVIGGLVYAISPQYRMRLGTIKKQEEML